MHQQGPAPQQMSKDGVGFPVAAVGDAVGPVAFSSLCATRDWLKTDKARAFMRAYRKARTMALDAPATEIARIEAAMFPHVDPQVLAATVEAYQGLGCWSTNVAIGQDAYSNLLDVFLFSGAINHRHPMADCVVPPPDAV